MCSACTHIVLLRAPTSNMYYAQHIIPTLLPIYQSFARVSLSSCSTASRTNPMHPLRSPIRSQTPASTSPLHQSVRLPHLSHRPTNRMRTSSSKAVADLPSWQGPTCTTTIEHRLCTFLAHSHCIPPSPLHLPHYRSLPEVRHRAADRIVGMRMRKVQLWKQRLDFGRNLVPLGLDLEPTQWTARFKHDRLKRPL